MQQSDDFGKYLGLPSFVGRNKKAMFDNIDQKLRHRIGSWHKKRLSCAGEEVLLKIVAQALLTYSMGVFLLPKNFCKKLEVNEHKMMG